MTWTPPRNILPEENPGHQTWTNGKVSIDVDYDHQGVAKITREALSLLLLTAGWTENPSMSMVDYSRAREYGRIIDRIYEPIDRDEFAERIAKAASRALADAVAAYKQEGLDVAAHPPEVKVSHDPMRGWFIVGWYVCIRGDE